MSQVEQFKATDAQLTERGQVAKQMKGVSDFARTLLKAVGPAGTDVGEFLLSLRRVTSMSMEQVFKVITSLEVVGLIRLEGSRYIVSEEIEAPL